MTREQNFVIPSSFYLLDRRIEVKFVHDMQTRDDAYGLSLYRKNLIEIQDTSEGCSRSPEQMAHTFWHEVIHWLYYTLGKDDFRNDEAHIDLMAGLIHQLMTTAEYTQTESA